MPACRIRRQRIARDKAGCRPSPQPPAGESGGRLPCVARARPFPELGQCRAGARRAGKRAAAKSSVPVPQPTSKTASPGCRPAKSSVHRRRAVSRPSVNAHAVQSNSHGLWRSMLSSRPTRAMGSDGIPGDAPPAGGDEETAAENRQVREPHPRSGQWREPPPGTVDVGDKAQGSAQYRDQRKSM